MGNGQSKAEKNLGTNLSKKKKLNEEEAKKFEELKKEAMEHSNEVNEILAK